MPFGSSSALSGKSITPSGSQTFNTSGTFTAPYGIRTFTVAGAGGD